jgi:hypothetical protein
MLPTASATVSSSWKSFDEARAAFDKVEVLKTRYGDLAALGFDPYASTNVTLLNYSDLIRRFVAGFMVAPDSLDAEIRDCFSVRERCHAVEIDINNTHADRKGNFLLDFLNFRRTTEVTGWRFNAVLVLKDDVVVYKLWGGRPVIREVSESHNPLGPLQGGGERILGR